MTIKGRDLIERISDKEYSEDLIKELEKYEVKRPKSVWELKGGDDYWRLIFNDKKYTDEKLEWNSYDVHGQILGLVHLTKERAELHARVLNTELAIKKWKRENDKVELDWSNKYQCKYFFWYDAENLKIYIGSRRTLKFANTIYFSSGDKAQQCIDDIGEERIIEWIKWEDNDQ